MEKNLIEVFNIISKNDELFSFLSSGGIPNIHSEMEKCQQQISRCQQLHQQAVILYQDKFGPPVPASDPICQQDIEQAKSVMNSPALYNLLFTTGRRFFAPKPKKQDYLTFCCSAEIIADYYQQRYDTLNEFNGLYGPDIEGKIDAGLKQARENISTRPEDWSTLPQTWTHSREIYLGDLELPLNQTHTEFIRQTNLSQKKGLINETDGDIWLEIPFSYNANKPFSLFISYEGNLKSSEEQLSRITRSIMYQIMHAMPAYSYQFVYLDPSLGGKNLQEINSALSDALDGNAFRLHDLLFPDHMFRLLTVGNTHETCRDLLKQIDDRIGLVNRICGAENVEEYNLSLFAPDGSLKSEARGLIPQIFVFWENSHINLSSEDVRTLLKLTDCAQKAGISLIVTSCRENGEDYTEEEKQLINQNSGHEHLDCLSLDDQGGSIDFDGNLVDIDPPARLFFNFNLWKNTEAHPDYLKQISKGFRPSLDMETDFIKRIPMETEWGNSFAENEIVVPVGVNSRDEIASIAIGGPDGAHALLAGSTGCGKSSYLHTIISGVIMRYKPSDVQLWLSDYKTAEFRRYMVNTPPHIQYVGTGRSIEYTFCFLDKIYAEYESRLKKFGILTSVKEYREKHGQDSLPRILIIIDEFHEMSSHIQDFPEYKTKLSALLRECRAVGMTFLLADQTCGVGLQGLAAAGKLQLTCRMAMTTTLEEYNAVFQISNAREVIPVQQKYEVVLQRMSHRINERGLVENQVYYEHCKTLYTSPENRTLIAEKAINTYGPAQDPLFIEEFHRVHADWPHIQDDRRHPLSGRGVPIFLGTPLSLEQLFRFYMIPNTGENMMSVVPFDEIQCSILLSALESLRRQENSEIYILANPNDFIFIYCETALKQIAEEDPRVHILSGLGEICKIIDRQCRTLNVCSHQREYSTRIYLFWLGLNDICDDMCKYPAARRENPSSSEPDAYASISSELDQLFGDSEDQPDLPEESFGSDNCYNASEDIRRLIDNGPRRDIHHLMFYSSYASVRKTRCVKAENVVHKIALGIGKDDALDYLGQSGAVLNAEGKILGNDTAAYTDGRSTVHFMPFISELEEKLLEQTQL